MPGQTLRSLIVSVTAETGAYQREMARAGRLGQSYFRTVTEGNRNAVSSWQSQQAAISAQNSAVSALSSTVSGYASAMAGALAVSNLLSRADNWNSLSARIKLVTASTDEFKETQTALFDISQRTTSRFSDNANLYTRSARSLKEVGYSAKQAVDFTEALATSFQISGSSAEEVTSVTTQLSQALAKGVLRGQDFNSVSQSGGRAMQVLADGLGVTTGALKSMADNGLLTTDKIVVALLGQLDKLRDEYKKMPSTISGSLTTLDNAFTRWVGGVDGATGTTQALSKVIVSLGENLDTVVAAVLSAGAAYGGLKFAQIAQAIWLKIQAQRVEIATQIGSTKAQVDATAIAVRKAQADILAARHQLTFAATAAEAAVATRALSAARLADVVATNAHTRALAAHTAASALGMRAGGALLGMLGGPAGLVALAAGAAASFFLFRDGAEAANTAAVDLKAPIADLRKEWEALGNAQRRPILSKLIEEQAAAKVKAAEIIKEMQAVAQGPVGDYSGRKRFEANQYQRASAARNFGRGIAGGIDIDQATQNLTGSIKPSNEVRSTLQALAAQYQETVGKVSIFGDQINALNDVMVKGEKAASGLGEGLSSIKPPSADVVDAWKKRVESITEQTAKLKDSTTLGEVNRQGERDGLSQTPEGRALLQQAQAAARLRDAEEQAKKAREEGARQAKQAADEAERRAKQLQDNYSRTLKTLQEQAEVHGQKTELAKIEFEVSRGALKNLDAAKKAELERAAVAVDHLNTQKSFKELMGDVQRQENSLLATTRKRYAELERIRAQGGLSSDQYREGVNAISKASVEDAPQFSGLDSSVTGASGELVKTAEAEAQLRKWHGRQLQMQSELLAETLANQETTNQQRLAAEQRYLDRVADITKTNNQQLTSIQDSYKVAVVGTFSELAGQAADMVGKIAGEQSGAYKALFVAQKAFAVASIIMNAQIAAAKAPAELTVLGGIPVGAALLAAGYANAGMVAGMALAGFSGGGYTGDGGKFEPKGVVHGGEFVLRKEVVRLPGMRDYLEGLNTRGYATGGYVGQAAAPSSPGFSMPRVPDSSSAAPQIHISIQGDGTGGAVASSEGYEAMGQALLNTVRQEMPKVARGVIIQEKGQNGLLDPSNRRNG